MKMTLNTSLKNRDEMTQKRTTYLNIMTVHSNPSPPYRCQKGNGILHMVCVIVHTTSKDDVNIRVACQAGNKIKHFKMRLCAPS